MNEMKSKEDILDKGEHIYMGNEFYVYRKDALKAMEEYASQVRQEQSR